MPKRLTPEERARRRREANRRRKQNYKGNHGCSYKVWKTAKKRQVKFMGSHLWLVWGGQKHHVVYIDQHRAVCDCSNWEAAYNQTCSHIQAVKNKVLETIAQA